MQYNGSRVAFSLFGIDIYWYAIIMVTGIIIATYGIGKEVKRMGEDEDNIYELALYAIPIAVIGARLYYVIFEWDRYRGDLLKILDMRSGGMAIHGGVIAGIIVGYIYARKKDLNFFKYSDSVMIFLPLAQAIGRWGNFINNEAHGGPTDLPWALIIDGQKYHPTFLYESLGNTILFIFLFYWARKKRKKYGETTSFYLIGYGVLRFFVEGFRTDSLWIGPLRQAQVISVISVILGFYILYRIKKSDSPKLVDTYSQAYQAGAGGEDGDN